MTMKVELNRAGVDTDGNQKSENEQERRATYSLSRYLHLQAFGTSVVQGFVYIKLGKSPTKEMTK